MFVQNDFVDPRFFLELYVDTSSQYIVDERLFPGLNDPRYMFEPALVIDIAADTRSSCMSTGRDQGAQISCVAAAHRHSVDNQEANYTSTEADMYSLSDLLSVHTTLECTTSCCKPDFHGADDARTFHGYPPNTAVMTASDSFPCTEVPMYPHHVPPLLKSCIRTAGTVGFSAFPEYVPSKTPHHMECHVGNFTNANRNANTPSNEDRTCQEGKRCHCDFVRTDTVTINKRKSATTQGLSTCSLSKKFKPTIDHNEQLDDVLRNILEDSNKDWKSLCHNGLSHFIGQDILYVL